MTARGEADALLAVLLTAQRLSFLGGAPISGQVDHALAHARAAGLERLPSGAAVLDLGSGAGVPGIVAAHHHSRLRFTLLDRSAKRSAFLREASCRLGLDVPFFATGDDFGRVTVAEGDAAELAHEERHRHRYAVVLSRAFGAPAVTAECATGFLAPGGTLVVAEPPQPDLLRWPEGALAQLGLAVAELVSGPPRFAVLTAVAPCAEAFPRPWKQIVKRPLY